MVPTVLRMWRRGGQRSLRKSGKMGMGRSMQMVCRMTRGIVCTAWVVKDWRRVGGWVKRCVEAVGKATTAGLSLSMPVMKQHPRQVMPPLAVLR
jgi:hypothetical protein